MHGQALHLHNKLTLSKEIHMTIVTDINNLINAAIETQSTDMTAVSKGGDYEDVLLPKGDYFGRMIEYIEYGKRIGMYQGKPNGKPPILNLKAGFVVYGPDGSSKIIRSTLLTLSNNEKAKFKILFDKLNYDGTIRHAAQRLGQAFTIPVEVYKTKAGKDVNIINYSGIRMLPKFDPNTGAAVSVPEATPEMLRLFLWNAPTQETWDALYIDGKRDDGTSKNFIQEDIMQAVDFEGSPLQMLLTGVSAAVQNVVPAAPVTPAAPTAPAAPAAPTAPVAPTAPTM